VPTSRRLVTIDRVPAGDYGEVLGLRWTDVDLDAGALWVRRAVQLPMGQADRPGGPQIKKLERDQFIEVQGVRGVGQCRTSADAHVAHLLSDHTGRARAGQAGCKQGRSGRAGPGTVCAVLWPRCSSNRSFQGLTRIVGAAEMISPTGGQVAPRFRRPSLPHAGCPGRPGRQRPLGLSSQ